VLVQRKLNGEVSDDRCSSSAFVDVCTEKSSCSSFTSDVKLSKLDRILVSPYCCFHVTNVILKAQFLDHPEAALAFEYYST